MLYFFAIVFPPLAVLLCKPGQFMFNVILSIMFWVPGSIHALHVVSSHLVSDKTGFHYTGFGLRRK